MTDEKTLSYRAVNLTDLINQMLGDIADGKFEPPHDMKERDMKALFMEFDALDLQDRMGMIAVMLEAMCEGRGQLIMAKVAECMTRACYGDMKQSAIIGREAYDMINSWGGKK